MVLLSSSPVNNNNNNNNSPSSSPNNNTNNKKDQADHDKETNVASSSSSSLPRDNNRQHVESSRISNEIVDVNELLRAEAISDDGLRFQFDALDRDGSGLLEKNEFRKFYTEELDDFGLEISEWEFEQLWWKICGKRNNTLDFKRFAVFMLKRVQM